MTAPLWTVSEAAAATSGLAERWEAASGVAIDTREMAPGDLFVALAGISHDGHVYVEQALAAGAAAAMVSQVPEGVPDDAPLLVVGDTLQGLRSLGAAGRARTQARVIGVTGSVGKTSTKDMLRVMLAGQGRTHAATRSFNNHWGVPLTLARMPVDSEFAVIEMGMNHAGEIAPLSHLARPHVALITTVEAVHLENFASVDGIADAKAEIFAGLGPDGIAVLNADNPYFGRLRAAAGDRPVHSFGRAAADFTLIGAEARGGRVHVEARIHGQPLVFEIGAPGVHFAMNALGALACVDAVGADVTVAARALADWSPPSGRGSRVEIALGAGRSLTLLDESYNANPASVGAALAVLAATPPAPPGRRIAILGDMLELGPDEAALHADLAALPQLAAVDLIHTCGPRMRHLHEALPAQKRGHWAEDSAALARALPKLVDAGDVCMVKGSLGAKMAVVVTAIRALGAEDPIAAGGGR